MIMIIITILHLLFTFKQIWKCSSYENKSITIINIIVTIKYLIAVAGRLAS